MAKTLLNGVNELLKRASIIQGDSGSLTTLTDSGRQVHIDVAVQVWNEAIEDLYETANMSKPNAIVEDTITLTTSTRNYTLASDLNELYYPLIDETNGNYITEYPGGYEQLIIDQPIQANYTGVPQMGCIRPTDGAFYLNTTPTSNENGLIYKYRYLSDFSVSTAAATFPFKDTVFRALVPAVTELWNRSRKNSFDAPQYKKSIGTAARYLNQVSYRDSWTPARYIRNDTSPFNE